MNPQELLNWYEKSAQPFLEKHAPERLEAVQADQQRLSRLLKTKDEVTICFLGNSGVGKSTLLNALAAGASQILPAGGIGPLTAQATEVRYSEEKRFLVTYHPKKNLWRLAFALETRLQAERRKAKKETDSASIEVHDTDADGALLEFASELTQDELAEALQQANIDPLVSIEEGAPEQEDALEGFIKQAKNIVCGKQFAERPMEYLVDGLRLACSYDPKWGSVIDAVDQVRIERIRQIMHSPKDDRRYERREGCDPRGFQEDMTAHAAGFLSPLIERIEVGWPSDLLKSGVVLVDLPGVGIAQDSYRDVTKSYVRDKARAVIVTVDRAGPTESTMDLLRTSGYWQRLVGAADDPASDACSMLIAVTRVDDVTQTEWQNQTFILEEGAPKPKKREVFAQLVEEFKPRMKAQIVEQLGNIGDSSNDSVNLARDQARATIMDSLEIHPVSAPELRKILLDDEDDRPFLASPEQTGIPQLQASLAGLAQQETERQRLAIEELTERLASTLISEMQLIEAKWQHENRAAEESEKLEKAITPILTEKKEEYRVRAAGFRNFLDETVPAKIEALVLEAQIAAEKDVKDYLTSLRGAHWGTLRAAVRRGGTFYGSRNINLPDDITGYFMEPMAAVWGQKLLRVIRAKTADLASDTVQLVQELCNCAIEQGGATIKKQLLQAQQDRIAALAKQIKTVGKEAVDELRQTVKSELSTTIRQPIKSACEQFVSNGNDIGPGVKVRILDLFSDLAKVATSAAKDPAIRILQENATRVRIEIQHELMKGGDPLQDTADLIIESHEARVRRSDSQKRKIILTEVRSVIVSFPGRPLCTMESEATH
ncbi:dynamin family protein [Synechococcus sp. CS-1326]|uniref:dynamin family protein n=1 Tax=Synechococcus sp. CS-1326 TaxID=2847978 RepID=UPI00223AC279|nr:dynamin family protein [Synechococcus sp. CS-1326]MCT0214372.1 dynamin family protein [Synechococcus sp. CS-1326]